MKIVSKLLLAGSLLLNLYFFIKESVSRSQIGDPEEEKAFQKAAPVNKPAESKSSDALTKNSLINVNRASFEDLLTLNGIGEDLAQKILENREAQGPFASVSDLTRVSGLGEKKLDMFRDVIETKD